MLGNNPFVKTLGNNTFLGGAVVGAAVTFLLTNEHVQKTIFRGVARAMTMVQGGLEEAKERYRDAEAELEIDDEEAEEAK